MVFKNKFNRRLFYFALGWGIMHIGNDLTRYYCCYFIGPAVPIVAISVGIAHNQYGVD